MQKRRGGWSILLREWSFVYLGRQRGVGSQFEKASLRPYLVVSAPSAGVSNVHEAKKASHLFQNEERVRAKCDMHVSKHEVHLLVATFQ